MIGIFTTSHFDNWFSSLKDRMVRARIQVRIDRAESGNFGDHKSVGDGVSEMRLAFGSGWRIYYTMRGSEMVVLLVGGDKSSQQADIEQAKTMAKQLKEQSL
jgi:putative addiction module killer protein